MYIPKKFIKDNYHVMSKGELHIVDKMELTEFQLECKLLTCREKEFYKRCVDIDKEVEDLINQSNMSTKATQNRLKRWQDLVQDDITATNKKWDEKIAFMKSAFEKDKVSLKQHQQNRIKDSKSEMPRNPAPNDEQIPLPQRQRTNKQTDTSENVSNNVSTTEERNDSTWISRLQKKDSKKVSSVSSASDKPLIDLSTFWSDPMPTINQDNSTKRKEMASKNLVPHPSHNPPSQSTPQTNTPKLKPQTETQQRRSLPTIPMPLLTNAPQLNPQTIPENQQRRSLRSSTSQKELSLNPK